MIPSVPLEPFLATAALAELAHEEAEAKQLAAATGDPWSPWHRVDGWQLNAEAHHDFVFKEGDAEHAVRVRFGDDGPRISIAGREYSLGRNVRTHAVRDGNDWHVLCDGTYRRLSLKSELAAWRTSRQPARRAAAVLPKSVKRVFEATAASTVFPGEDSDHAMNGARSRRPV